MEPLSPREQFVLERLAEGMTVREIASESYLSPETVATQAKSVLRKLGAKTRAEAMVIAVKRGLV